MKDKEKEKEERGAMVRALFGFWATPVMYSLIDLGVIDDLARDSREIADLADALGADVSALRRLLRAASALGLVTHDGNDHLTLTGKGRLLAKDEPGSIQNLVRLWGGSGGWQSWGRLSQSVTTGRAAFDDVAGVPLFEYLDDHPDEQAVFDEAMSESTRVASPGIASACDLGSIGTVIDIGGGNGTLMAALLVANPGLRGVVFDRPQALDGANKVLEASGVDRRCEVVAGNFFHDVPQGADAYLLKSVLHDWDDERSISILKRCRAASKPSSRLIIVESVIGTSDQEFGGNPFPLISDLNMLVYTGGVERSRDQFDQLVDSAGFQIDTVTACPSPSTLYVLSAHGV